MLVTNMIVDIVNFGAQVCDPDTFGLRHITFNLMYSQSIET